LLRFGIVCIACFLWKLVLGKKGDFSASYPENILLKIDAGLVGFEHVQAEEQVDIAALNGCLSKLLQTNYEEQITSMTVIEHGR
jgi:hypothetical protein